MLKKVLKSKIFISIILLALTAVMVFVLLPMNYEKQTQTIDVVQFVTDVKQGTKITENMLATRTIGLYGIDTNYVVTSKNDIVGKYAAMDIRRTSNLYKDMFTEDWQEVEGAIDLLLDKSDQLITISLGSGAQSVGGEIKPGSVVDILTLSDEGAGETQLDEFGYPIESTGGAEMELTPLLENVVVYKVLNNALENIADLKRQWISLVENGDDAAENFDSSMTPAFVTLIVNHEQALLLANQENGGHFHIVLKPLVDAEDLPTSRPGTSQDIPTTEPEVQEPDTTMPDVEGGETTEPEVTDEEDVYDPFDQLDTP